MKERDEDWLVESNLEKNNWFRFDLKFVNTCAFLLTIDQGSRYVHLLVMMRRRVLLVVVWRMYLQQVRSRLGEGRWRRFPRSGDTGAGRNVLILTAELVARARGSRAGAIRDSVSVIIVANFPVIIIVIVIVTAIAIVREARGGRARRRATTTTSTATDTTTANAVDLHHFAVDRSRRLGSTRRGRDAATDHHHQTISPPPPPRSATAPPSPVLPPLLRMHHVYLRIAFVSHSTDFSLCFAPIAILRMLTSVTRLTYHLAILLFGVQRLRIFSYALSNIERTFFDLRTNDIP